MLQVQTEITDKYSWYRTKNTFVHLAKIESVEDFFEAENYAQKNDLNMYSLGNGSNTFFQNKTINSFILKNNLPQEFNYLGNDLFEVSSSLSIIQLLKNLYQEQREGPYYLASVPATIGGAIAMNAGTGRGKGHYISEYLESVEYVYQGKIYQITPKEMNIGYRQTMFSESRKYFIVKAIFRFPEQKFEVDPIKLRIEKSKKTQDLKYPSCGSVFRIFDHRPMKILRHFFGKGKAFWSQKTFNWINNESDDPRHLRRLLLISRLVHLLFGKKCDPEIRIVK